MNVVRIFLLSKCYLVGFCKIWLKLISLTKEYCKSLSQTAISVMQSLQMWFIFISLLAPSSRTGAGRNYYRLLRCLK
jgi:hypothetical protein